MARYGIDGKRGGQPTWGDHMRTSAGKAELRAFVERVLWRYMAQVRAQPAHLLQGALRPPVRIGACLVGRLRAYCSELHARHWFR